MIPNAAHVRHRALRVCLSTSLFATLVVLWARPTRSEQCPQNEPEWIGGRVVVWEQNLNPEQLRGVGEVFVYAFEPCNSTPGTRYMAVTDADGYFCIHDTFAGDWVITAFEPFQFRPFVTELSCSAGNCDLGEIRIDQSMVRISDDFVNWNGSWNWGSFAQSIVAPSGALSLVKVTFRTADTGGSDHDVHVYDGDGSSGTLPTNPVGSSMLHFHSSATGARATAVFDPGAVTISAGSPYTVVLGGSSCAWRLDNNAYGDGQMYGVNGNTLTPMSGQDLCLTLGVDGPDGNLTSFVVAGENGWVSGDTVSQSFLATSEEITHASLFVGTPCSFCRIRASVHETLGGPPIGPVKETQGLQQQGVAFGWFAGEVPVDPGQTYYVTFAFPDGANAVYARDSAPGGGDAYAGGQAYANGGGQGKDIWGRVMGPATASSVVVCPDAGTPSVDGAITPDSAPPADGQTPPDGTSAADGTTATDGHSADPDATTPPPDGTLADGGSPNADGGQNASADNVSGGCGCRSATPRSTVSTASTASPTSPPTPPPWGALAVFGFAFLLIMRRRQRILGRCSGSRRPPDG
jgi:MYXO-CTERM domain-containing protein